MPGAFSSNLTAAIPAFRAWIETVLCEFEKGNSDFNDQVLCEICKEKGFTLVTDDPDFSGSGVTILTANSRLLSP